LGDLLESDGWLVGVLLPDLSDELGFLLSEVFLGAHAGVDLLGFFYLPDF
jgi:hypothetical protein